MNLAKPSSSYSYTGTAVLNLPESTLRIGLQKAHMPIGHADREKELACFYWQRQAWKVTFLMSDKYVENYSEENEVCISQAGE